MKLIRICAGFCLGAVATAFGITFLIFGVPFAIGIGLDLVDLTGGQLVRVSLGCLFAVACCTAAIWGCADVRVPRTGVSVHMVTTMTLMRTRRWRLPSVELAKPWFAGKYWSTRWWQDTSGERDHQTDERVAIDEPGLPIEDSRGTRCPTRIWGEGKPRCRSEGPLYPIGELPRVIAAAALLTAERPVSRCKIA